MQASHTAILELTTSRLRLFFREPGSVFWSFGFPLVLTVALGIAFRNRPPDAVVVAVQMGEGAEHIMAELAGDATIRARLLTAEEADTELRTGRVTLIVAAGTPRVYTFDPTREDSRLARALVDDTLQRAEGRRDVRPTIDKPKTEAGSRYVDFLVPGLIGVNIMSSGMWGIGYEIVAVRTHKLLKRMLATPMRRSQFLLSFIFMRMLFLCLELPVLLGFAYLAFGVTVRGSVGLIVALATLGALAFSGLGVLVASRAQNTATVSGLINIVMMPMFVGSGVFFSSTRFPEVVQPFLKALPLTALNDSLRLVVNEGAGLGVVWPQMALLAGVALAAFALALKLFRWS